MKSIIYILFLFGFLASCTSTKDEVNVQELNQKFISAWNSKNADEVISYLGDDVQFVQGEIHLNGKSEVSQRWVRETINTISDLKTNAVSSGKDNSIAYEAGTFSVDVLPAAPNEPFGIGEGNFMLLWKKGENGEWKLSYAQLEDMPVQARN